MTTLLTRCPMAVKQPGRRQGIRTHGLWADGSCFSKVMVPLQAEGYQVIASEHGLNSLESGWRIS